MLKKILLALDGSLNAEQALPWIKQIARPGTSQVVLFRAVDTDFLEKEFVPSELQDARNYLLRMESDLNFAGLPAKIVVREGKPASEIVKAAIREGCDLIVMTTRGGSEIRRWILGGITERVLRVSPIPVLPVRRGTALPRQGHVRRVLVPMDGSKRAEAALPWARMLAVSLRARLLLVPVHPAESGGLPFRRRERVDALRKHMLDLVDRLKEHGVRAAFVLQRGDAADRILNVADRSDLVVTTPADFGGFKRWVFGSVAEKLIHEARVPVLVYKSDAQAATKAS